MRSWSDDLGVPPVPSYAWGLIIKQQAYDVEPDDDTKFARKDWGHPGENHETIDNDKNQTTASTTLRVPVVQREFWGCAVVYGYRAWLSAKCG